MIIIKMIILYYFIQIRHTDDFPSTGTRLLLVKVSQSAYLYPHPFFRHDRRTATKLGTHVRIDKGEPLT